MNKDITKEKKRGRPMGAPTRYKKSLKSMVSDIMADGIDVVPDVIEEINNRFNKQVGLDYSRGSLNNLVCKERKTYAEK